MTTQLMTTKKQYTPPGCPPLPPIRLFCVRRPENIPDEMVEGTGLGIEGSGVLKITELVYDKDTDGNPVMLLFVRRMFRVWLDVEEIVGGVPMLTSVN
jgi:hypothetical protein